MSRRAPYLLFVLLTLHGAKACDPFKNIKAIIYTGSELDPQELVLEKGAKDLIDAYRVEINGENIPKLCSNGVSGLENLDTLVMINCGIKEIEVGAFKDLPRLRVLDLSHNKIKSLVGGVFDGSHVRKVNLSVNALEKIEVGAFKNMPNLHVLDMGQNKIKEVNKDWFSDNHKLYRLILDDNEITEIPKAAFVNMESEGNLDIWLNNNKISKIQPDAFKGVDKLITLWMSDNELRDLHPDLFKGIQIGSLYIGDNKIVCLSDDFLRNLSVKEIDVDGNPLDCDCLRKIRKWGQKRNVDTRTMRRGFACLREKIDDAMSAQKDYYEEKLIENKF